MTEEEIDRKVNLAPSRNPNSNPDPSDRNLNPNPLPSPQQKRMRTTRKGGVKIISKKEYAKEQALEASLMG